MPSASTPGVFPSRFWVPSWRECRSGCRAGVDPLYLLAVAFAVHGIRDSLPAFRDGWNSLPPSKASEAP